MLEIQYLGSESANWWQIIKWHHIYSRLVLIKHTNYVFGPHLKLYDNGFQNNHLEVNILKAQLKTLFSKIIPRRNKKILIHGIHGIILIKKHYLFLIFSFEQSDILEHTLAETLEYILFALVHNTAGPHLHMNMNTRQHANKQTDRHTHMPSHITHRVQTKSEFSQTGNDVSSCLQGDGGSC